MAAFGDYFLGGGVPRSTEYHLTRDGGCALFHSFKEHTLCPPTDAYVEVLTSDMTYLEPDPSAATKVR